MTKRYFEPKGFDVEHIYRINIGMKNDISEDDDQRDESKPKIDIFTVFDRIKSYPGVENACISFAAIPYSNSYSSTSIFLDTISSSTRMKMVSPEYFDVFKIQIQNGKIFTWDDAVEDKSVLISPNRNNEFLNMHVGKVQSFYMGRSSDTPDPDRQRTVMGIVSKTKWSEYHDYEAMMYYPVKKNDTRFGTGEICVRLKPEADHDFVSRFTKDMSEQLEIGKYYLSSVESLQERRADFIKSHEFDTNMNSMYSIVTFLVINIFLAIIGTFWFRTRARRNEIGVRLAHGASKANIKSMFTLETILLLFLASIIGAILCINISVADILKDMDLPVANRRGLVPTTTDHIIDYILTFFILSVITFIAVLYPASRASKIPPAEALRDE